MPDNNLILPPLNYDPAVVASPLGAVGGVTSRQAIEAEVDEQLKLFDWGRYRQLQRAKETHEPIYSPQVDPYTGESEVLGYRKLPRKLLSAEEANRKYGLPDKGLTFNEPITEEAATIIRKRKEAEVYNQQVIAEASGWNTTKAFGMGILASLVQPEQIAVNVLGSLIAAPIAGFRYTPEVLEAMTTGRRLATRAKLGAIEGFVGSVVAEPVQRHFAFEEHADYDLSNTLSNLAAGTALGSSLHIVAGTGADWINGLRASTWQEGLRTAVKQLVEGKTVEVTPIIQNDPGVIARNTPTDNVLLTPSKTPPLPEVATPENEALIASIKQSINELPVAVTEPDDIKTLKNAVDSGHVEYSIASDGIVVDGKKYQVDNTQLFGERLLPTQENIDRTLKETNTEDMLHDKYLRSDKVQLALQFGNGFLATNLNIEKWLPELLLMKTNDPHFGQNLIDLARNVAKFLLETKGVAVAFDKVATTGKSNTSSFDDLPFILVGRVIGGVPPVDTKIVPKGTLIDLLSHDSVITSGHKRSPTLQKELSEKIALALEKQSVDFTSQFIDKNKQIAKLDDELISALAGGSISNDDAISFNQDVRSIDQFEKIPGTEHLMSSNQGAVYTDKASGKQYFVKKNKTNEHSINEYVANRFYQRLGVMVGKDILIKDGDNLLLGSEIVDSDGWNAVSIATEGDLKDLAGITPGYGPSKYFIDAWVVDAWLSNWDALAPGNIVLDDMGQPWRIDQGGALLFRAQGEPKVGQEFGNSVQELWSIPYNNPIVMEYLKNQGVNDPGMAYSTEMHAYLAGNEYAQKIVGLSPNEIRALVKDAFPEDSPLLDSIVSKLIARQEDLIQIMGAKVSIADNMKIFGKKVFRKGKNALTWLNSVSIRLNKLYSPEERTAIGDYQGSSGAINSFLRSASKRGPVDLNNQPDHKSAIVGSIRALDSAMKQWSIPAPMKVFRWVNSSWYNLDFSNVSKLIGAKYWDPGFASTSLYKNNSFEERDVLLTINLPQGQSAVLADAAWSTGKSSFSSDEAEVILPRDMHYIIHSAEKGSNGKIYLTLEALPNKIAGMNMHDAVQKATAWQKEKTLAAQGSSSPLSAEQVKEALDSLAVKKGPIPTLTEQVLTKQEKDLNELISVLEKKLEIEFPDSLDELSGIIDESNQNIKFADAYSRAMVKAANCYTGS